MALTDVLRVNKIKAELAAANAEHSRLSTELTNCQNAYRVVQSNLAVADSENGRLAAELTNAQQNLANLQKVLKETERFTLEDIKREISELEARRVSSEAAAVEARRQAEQITAQMQSQLNANDAACKKHIADLNREIEARKKQIIVLDEEILLQSFGFYRSHFNLPTSEHYKARINRNIDAQARLIKNKEAAVCPANWTVDGDRSKGEKMVRDIAKLLIRSFNNECDACIAAVKYNNVDSMEKRIQRAFESLNKLGERTHVSLINQFLNLKLEELYLTHEYHVIKQKEREEQKRIREQMREEARIQREIEEMKAKLEKEERHFDRALEAMKSQMETAKTDTERKLLESEMHTIEEKKAEVEKQKEDVLYREQNTRAGYVYIISNIGAFGENIYKIGVTRRLDPEERVDELGDASVPFYFDVHALIFSDDAPSLENALHKAFDERRVNAINTRKEFFRVTLEEIESVVHNNFSKPVEFTRTAAAEDYRETLMLRKSQNRHEDDQQSITPRILSV